MTVYFISSCGVLSKNDATEDEKHKQSKGSKAKSLACLFKHCLNCSSVTTFPQIFSIAVDPVMVFEKISWFVI